MNDVTGGNLYGLWQAGHRILPEISNFYGEVSSMLGGGQEGMAEPFAAGQSGASGHTYYSPIYASFQNVYNEFQHIMATSASNTAATAQATQQALEHYKAQDSAASAEFEQIIETGLANDGTQMHNPDDKAFGDPAEPVEPDYYDSPGDDAAEDPNAENEDIEDAKSTINDNTEPSDDDEDDDSEEESG